MSGLLTIEGLGLRQTRVTRDDLEMIRQWRLQPSVRQHMFFQGDITPEMQVQWFERIDNERNFYWVVHVDGRPVALNSLKDLNEARTEGEGGLFIADESLRGELTVFRIAIPPLVWLFGEFGLQAVVASVRADNKRALRYNRALGHVVESAEGEPVVRTRLTRTAFLSRLDFFKAIFSGEELCRVTTT